jgi:hypothetical protein
MLFAMTAQVFAESGAGLVVEEHQTAMAAARELLTRTVELPDTKGELLDVLGEYRRTLVRVAVSEVSTEGPAPCRAASCGRGVAADG